MAIQFGRIEIVSRKNGGNACRKAAYNARTIIKDQQTGIIYDFTKKGRNVYHVILLPDHVDKKFKDPEILMNEVERHEKKKNSQLLKDVVIALPDEKELTLEDRIAITHEIIDEMAWIKNGLAAQIDIHQPHIGDRNWHAHVLLLTRRFTKDGKSLGAKATDLNPQFRNSKGGKGFIIPEEEMIHEKARDVINQYFVKLGLDKRVDAIGAIAQEHIGPAKMRSLINNLVEYNEWRKIGNVEIKKDADWLINNITKYQAIFSEHDVTKLVEKEIEGVKVEVVKIQKQLIEQVMSSSRLIQLYDKDGEGIYDQNGKETKYYTTKEVRDEELRLLRIANTVKEQMNYRNINNLAHDIQNLDNVSRVQRESLSSILLTNQGVRILRGRAGTGKSEVLGIAYKLATNRGQNVIGLAPTHKAALELKNKGYQQSSTVKSFLFKLYNGKVNLPYNSLLVVDEAGMIGTSDYLELFKVARKYDCQVILAGDERQLASVERSGMFEVFADKFGSYVLSDIKRQKQSWGRQMAMCFAVGDIANGIKLLEENGGLKFDHTLAESMNRLITDWHNSEYPIEKRLIITVRNKEVDALNQNIRKLLKEQNILTGKEYRKTSFDQQSGKNVSEYYMVGDRIVFKTSNQELQTKNGEFATLLQVSKNKFIAKTDNGQEIIFNPAEISFKHGYASTVYKAQAASIKDVYVLHNLAGNSRSSYVEMTRYVERIGLYANTYTTRGIVGLVSQLARISDKLASINFRTHEDLVRNNQDNQQLKVTKPNKSTTSTILEKAGNHLKSIAINIADRLHSNPQYYKIVGTMEQAAKVEEVVKQTEEILTNKLKTKKTINMNNNQINESQKTAIEKTSTGQQEMYNLKQQLFGRTEGIAYSILGTPNKELSTRDVLRWGNTGKLAVKITGSKAGQWYDFSNGTGGDLISLVQREKNYSFIQAKEYLRDMASITNYSQDQVIWLRGNEQYTEADKIERVELLYEKSVSIKNSIANNVAAKYLSEHRGIKTVVTSSQLSQDLRLGEILDRAYNKYNIYHPALLAFARDSKGKITGVQSIYLNKETGSKADIPVNKRSFGKIKGSFVEIQQDNQQKSSKNNITIIAEGVETALSIQEAGIKGRILCSLGISNIKNYQPLQGEKIIIATGNDGKISTSVDVVTKSASELASKGAVVSVIMPPEKGDFNDMLKTTGVESIKEFMEPEIAKLTGDKLITDEKITKLTTNTGSLEPINTSDNELYKVDNVKSQINSIELELRKSADNKVLEEFQQQIKSLERFAVTKDINTALQIYKEKGIESFINYSSNTCAKAIQQKIINDLVTMQDKFNPNHDLGKVRFCDVVIHDFTGKSHTVPEDYLAAIGKDKQVMQYINPQSIIGEEIKNELQNAAEMQKNQGIKAKCAIH